MADILKTLYKEYTTLKEKLDKVSDLIKLYGGSLPSTEEEQTLFNDSYPQNGTWKDKIFYALQQLNQPSTAREIADFLMQYDSEHSEHIKNMVTQYTSSLAGAGTLDVDRSKFPGKYFLK